LALRGFFIAPRDAHDFKCTPRDTHDSTRATCGPDVHDSARGSDVPALLASPLGYVGATSTASTSAIATGKGRIGGTSGQPSFDDNVGESKASD
jgi:hypothetical protein